MTTAHELNEHGLLFLSTQERVSADASSRVAIRDPEWPRLLGTGLRWIHPSTFEITSTQPKEQ